MVGQNDINRLSVRLVVKSGIIQIKKKEIRQIRFNLANKTAISFRTTSTSPCCEIPGFNKPSFFVAKGEIIIRILHIRVKAV